MPALLILLSAAIAGYAPLGRQSLNFESIAGGFLPAVNFARAM